MNEYVKIALFAAMMPQYLTGDEFSYLEHEGKDELTKSPVGQLCAIISQKESKCTTYVDIEGCWTSFADENTSQLNFYENVVEYILTEVSVPFLLVYKVCSCPIQRKVVRLEMIHEYIVHTIGLKYKKDRKIKLDKGGH
mmetsp:Transcript_41364/g.47683  ORF Transcript_41364/g.47683 Transcript_41364/m.47683 type:complete len:139 (-) Transcript_41364:181-597(-)